VIKHSVNRTGGSVLPAIIMHDGSNVWGKALVLGILDQGSILAHG
jgi:hypothetical protein